MFAFLSYFAETLLLSIMHFLGIKAKTALFFHQMKMGSVNFFLKIGATDSTQNGSITEWIFLFCGAHPNLLPLCNHSLSLPCKTLFQKTCENDSPML